MRMTRTLAVIGFTVAAISQTGISALAQFNVQNGDETVSIGPNGISVQKRGHDSQTVNITPGGIDIKDSTQKQHVNIRSNEPGRSMIINQGSLPTTGVSTLSLDQQVGLIEMSVSGKRVVGKPLLARVEKLEIDNIGAKGTGSVKVRIAKLATTLGVNISGTSSSANVNIDKGSTTIVNTGSGIVVPNRKEAATVIENGPNHDLVLNASNQTVSYRCRGGDAVVNAHKSRIHLLGKINDLVINGHDNVISCDLVDEIVVNGHNNNVSYRNPSKPDITDNGSNNKVLNQ